jgi:hypothetical protein
MRISAVPIDFDAAADFVRLHHRHHTPPQGHKFSIGASREPRFWRPDIRSLPKSKGVRGTAHRARAPTNIQPKISFCGIEPHDSAQRRSLGACGRCADPSRKVGAPEDHAQGDCAAPPTHSALGRPARRADETARPSGHAVRTRRCST